MPGNWDNDEEEAACGRTPCADIDSTPVFRTMKLFLICAILLAGRLNLFAASAPSAPTTAPVAVAEIGSTAGQAIPPTFMGLSHEWGLAQDLMGSAASGRNNIYRQLLRNLTSYGSGPVILRIGGNSTDYTGEPKPGMLQPFADLANEMGVRFYLGVNLGSGNPQLAVDQEKAYLNQMPPGSVEGIEIGNEPDGYRWNGKRARSYVFANFLPESNAFQQGLLAALPPPVRLMGPSYGSPTPMNDFIAYIKSIPPSRLIASQHFYVSNSATHPNLPADYLLGAAASTSGPSEGAARVAAAHQYGSPFWLDEMNSISGGGEPGVSNVFASALWAMDVMFEFARTGVDGVNWHTGNGGNYAAFEFQIDSVGQRKTYSLRTVKPLYYGLLMFQQATGDGARLLPVKLETSGNVKVWATVGSQGVVRALILNKDENATGPVTLTMPGFRKATVERLTAPSYQSTTGIKIGGQTFDGSPDGKLQGERSGESVLPAHSNYVINMPACSAALVTFSR